VKNPPRRIGGSSSGAPIDLGISWRRRYSSYVALYLGRRAPIVVYQMGKVGSSSIRNALLRRGLHPVLHLHTMSPLREKEAEAVAIDAGLEDALHREIEHARTVFAQLGSFAKLRLVLHEWLNERRISRRLLRPGRPLRIITSVREPVAASVSMFFQLLPWYLGGPYRPDRVSTDALIRLFFERYSWERPLIWFDEEMRYATGVDVYRHPFSGNEGFLSFREGSIDVLVLKTETDDAVKERALSEFLGLEGIRLARSNIASDKSYALQYQEFKDRIRFPDDFFRSMYDSKYARHFYEVAELERHAASWHGSFRPASRPR
jgi:hypothetical protein